MLNKSRLGKGEFSILRQQMVDHQLWRRQIRDLSVLLAMGAVPREEFVPASLRRQAYEDRALPIGFGQTISQPWTVAFMAQALRLDGAERVLEIGTGSGYAAAVLSLAAREVHTVERVAPLAREAGARLARLGFDNVVVHTADGTQGLVQLAPFDAIIVAAAARELPQPLVEQMAEGGRLLIPIGEIAAFQTMCRFTMHDHRTTSEKLGSFAFVPLIGLPVRPDGRS